MSESDVEFVREWKEIPEPKQLVKFTDAQRLRNVRIKRTTVKASDEQSDEPKISAEKDPLALGPVLYKCNICVSSCYDAHGIIAHMNVHPRAKRSPSARAYECDTCGKKFPHRRNILAHLRRMHSAERSSTLKRYVSEGRPGERAYEHAYVCAHCEKTFERDANMKRHIRNVHDGRESRCDICSRVFSCSEYVKKHIYRTHRKNKEKCDVPKCWYFRRLRSHWEECATHLRPCFLCSGTKYSAPEPRSHIYLPMYL